MPFGQISIDQANAAYNIAWWVSIIGAALTAVSLAVLYWSSGIRDRHNDARIAELNARAAVAERETAGLQKDAAQLRLDLEKERARNAPRVLTHAQWDALEELRGKVSAVNVGWEKNTECAVFGTQIVTALMAAGITVRVYDVQPGAHWTGIMAQGGGLSSEHELVKALQKAGLYGGHTTLATGSAPGAPTDVPLLLVGERYLQFDAPPMFNRQTLAPPQESK